MAGALLDMVWKVAGASVSTECSGMTHPELPGWEMQVKPFDHGRVVAIQKVKDGIATRHAVGVGMLSEADAIERAVPTLRKWAGIS